MTVDAPHDLVEKVIVAAGGPVKLAKLLGVTYQAIQRWQEMGRVPAERVLSVEAAVGIDRSDIRPDLYPPTARKRS